MRSNWQTGLDRFKALQTQARVTRDERNQLLKTNEELKAQIEAGGNSEATAVAAVRRLPPVLQVMLTEETSQAEAQSKSEAALAELQTRLSASEAEKTALEARLADLEKAQGDIVKSLEDKIAVLEAEKLTLTAERDVRYRCQLAGDSCLPCLSCSAFTPAKSLSSETT